MTDQLIRVVAPHFVAGIIMGADRCVRAAPILRWTIGKDRAEPLWAWHLVRAWARYPGLLREEVAEAHEEVMG